MRFEWHAAKAIGNLRKHGVSMQEACSVFNDRLATTYMDTEHSIGEQRYITFGHSELYRLLAVVHTESGGTVRIISARCVTPTERRLHEES